MVYYDIVNYDLHVIGVLSIYDANEPIYIYISKRNLNPLLTHKNVLEFVWT
jgi:hypothetical protein